MTYYRRNQLDTDIAALIADHDQRHPDTPYLPTEQPTTRKASRAKSA